MMLWRSTGKHSHTAAAHPKSGAWHRQLSHKHRNTHTPAAHMDTFTQTHTYMGIVQVAFCRLAFVFVLFVWLTKCKRKMCRNGTKQMRRWKSEQEGDRKTGMGRLAREQQRGAKSDKHWGAISVRRRFHRSFVECSKKKKKKIYAAGGGEEESHGVGVGGDEGQGIEVPAKV